MGAIGAPAARREAVHHGRLAVAQQHLHGVAVEIAAGGVLPEAHRAILLGRDVRLGLAAVEPRHLDHRAPALGARPERLVRVVELVVLESLRAIDDLGGVLRDLGHELLRRAPAALDLDQVALDLAGELRRGEPIDVDALQRVDQPDALHGGSQPLVEAHDVALRDQVLDDVRARRRRADPLLVEHRREVLVLDLLAGVLHQREQARLADARRRLRLLGRGLDVRDGDAHALGVARAGDERPQRHLAGILVGRRREHRAPALLLEEARARAEALARDLADALHALPDRRAVERAEEAAHDQVEQALVVAGQDRCREASRSE